MKTLTFTAAAGIIAALMFSMEAMSATDGTLGNSSNGDVDVTISRGALVQVSFPNADIGLTYADDATDETATEEFCIYSNQGSGSVDIDITVDPTNDNSTNAGDNAADAPVLISAGNELEYTLALKLQGGAQISAAADDIGEIGLTIANHTTANTDATDCTTGGNSHEFVVTISETAFEAVPAGDYADTVAVTVAAN